MEILVAKFQLEANQYVPMKCDIENVALSFGASALKHMQLGDVFESSDIRLIPVLCADAACSGVMTYDCFNYIEQRILKSVRSHIDTLDGIYLHLHGGSFVEKIGSGEHHLVHAIRQIVGPYLPIAVSCDPHGNLTKQYVEETTIIRSYRQAPHTDIAETVQTVCQKLIDLIRKRQNPVPVYRKLPLILGGEQSVSTDEPVCSINRYLNAIEEDDQVLSASWHVGYLRHDCPEAGAGVVVVPIDAKARGHAQRVADQLADFVWKKRHEFHYTGETAAPEEALSLALHYEGKPVFITDSGDNVTSGAIGANTEILKQVLALKGLTKRFLFAAINDPSAYQHLESLADGEQTTIMLGQNLDDLSSPIYLNVTVLHHGRQEGTNLYGEQGDYGGIVTVTINDKPIDIAVTDNNHSFVEHHQIIACGVDWDDYDIIVVKQGYIHPELKTKSAMSVMSLTNGVTPQDIKLIPFKLVMRPMYPLDNI